MRFEWRHLWRAASISCNFHWKKGLQHGCFLMNSGRCLRHRFYRTSPGNYFCSTENKIVKNALRKVKNWKHLVRKTTTPQNWSLFTSSLHILSKKFFNLSSASLDILKTRVLRSSAIPLRTYISSSRKKNKFTQSFT